MKVVSVEFVHIKEKDSNGKPRTTTSTVVCEDDLDGYDIMGEFDNTVDFGWIVSKMTTVKQGLKIIRTDCHC